MLDTELRATWILMLSGFTRNTECVAIDGDDGADDAAAGHHVVTVLQTRPASCCVCLRWRCIGQEEEKIKDPEDEEDGEESQQGVGGDAD